MGIKLNRTLYQFVVGSMAMLLFIFVGIPACFGLWNREITGVVREIRSNSIVLKPLEEFFPSNEHVPIPSWIRPGVSVTICYYTQKDVQFFTEIVQAAGHLKAKNKRRISAPDH